MDNLHFTTIHLEHMLITFTKSRKRKEEKFTPLQQHMAHWTDKIISNENIVCSKMLVKVPYIVKAHSITNLDN